MFAFLTVLDLEDGNYMVIYLHSYVIISCRVKLFNVFEIKLKVLNMTRLGKFCGENQLHVQIDDSTVLKEERLWQNTGLSLAQFVFCMCSLAGWAAPRPLCLHITNAFDSHTK